MKDILKKKKIAFHTLGCKVNLYETDVMKTDVRNAGAEIVDFRDMADVYVVNTCTVTNIADRKSRQILHRARKENPEATVVACGCYPSVRGASELYDEGVSLVLGNEEKKNLSLYLSAYLENRTVPEIKAIDTVKEYTPECFSVSGQRTRADIKIQDGCNQFCTYCTIPFARGRIRSKKPEDVIAEVKAVTESGVKEIVLAGIHLSSYGRDLPSEGADLITLIESLNQIPTVERIRIGSLEPKIVTREFAERLSQVKKLCPHFHLSLQSGCDKTLKRMNRHYTADEFRVSVGLLREYFDRPAITTDIIAGFPGETEKDFEESYVFAKSVGFYEMHVFPYSRRKGTAADGMEGQLTQEVKEKRAKKLIELSEQMSKEYILSSNEREIEVLTEEEKMLKNEPCFVGYTREYVRVFVPDASENNRIFHGILVLKEGVPVLQSVR